MIIVLSVCALLCSLLNMLIFDGSTVFGVIVCVLAVLAIGFKLFLHFFGKQLAAKRFIPWALCLAGAAMLIVSGFAGTTDWEMHTAVSEWGAVDRILASGDAESALERLEDMKEAYPDSVEIHLRQYEAYLLLEDGSAARNALNRCADSKDLRYYMARASWELRENKQADAKNTYIEAAALYPQNWEAQFYAGYLCFMRGENTRAKFYLLRACELAPGEPLPLFFLGSAQFALGEYKDAEWSLRRVLKMKIDADMKQDVYDILASIPRKGA